MDADKLNEAAEKAATIQYRNLSDPDVSQDGRTEAMFASMFEQGAHWLMQQPLADRLTKEEKEKIKKLYLTDEEIDGVKSAFGAYPVAAAVITKNILEQIFGKELFIDK